MLSLKCKALFPTVTLIWLFSTSTYATELSTVSISHGEYMVKTEILLPHLENNLHYTTTQTRQCLGQQDASTLFPILDHVSFVGCALVKKHANPENNAFDLVCSNPEAATGQAHFVIEKETFRATLSVKMGGKNMKFSQRVNGRRIGAC